MRLEEYHALADADPPVWSSSMLHTFRESPAYAAGRWVHRMIPPPTYGLDVLRGTIVDEVLLSDARWVPLDMWPRVLDELAARMPKGKNGQKLDWSKVGREASLLRRGDGSLVGVLPPECDRRTVPGREAWSLFMESVGDFPMLTEDVAGGWRTRYEAEDIIMFISDCAPSCPAAIIAEELLCGDSGVSQPEGLFQVLGIPCRWRGDRFVESGVAGEWAAGWAPDALVELKVSRNWPERMFRRQLEREWGLRLAFYELGWICTDLRVDEPPYAPDWSMAPEYAPGLEWIFVVAYHQPVPVVRVYRIREDQKQWFRRECWARLTMLKDCLETEQWYDREAEAGVVTI